MEKFRWIVGKWNHENIVPATRVSPAYADVGSSRFSLCENGNWILRRSPDGREVPHLTFDPFSRQWIYVLTNGAYGISRSSEGGTQTKKGDRMVFTGLMTLLGINCDWRMTWTRYSLDESASSTRSSPTAALGYTSTSGICAANQPAVLTHFSAAAFRSRRPLSKCSPIIWSMSTRTLISFSM